MPLHYLSFFSFFFFNDTATTEIYTLSLHDALPISPRGPLCRAAGARAGRGPGWPAAAPPRRPTRGRSASARAGRPPPARSEEHTSELQSQSKLVCRLLLEKKKKNKITR